MSIAFDVGPLRADPAGVGMYVRSLAQGLAAIGRRDIVHVGRRLDAEGLPPGVPSIARSASVPYPLWVELLAPIAVRDSRATLAHFTDGLVPLVRTRPTVVTVLDLSLVREWRAHRVVRYPRIPFVLAAPKLANRVITISQATADEVMRLTGTPSSKIDVITLAPRPAAARAADEIVEATMQHHGLARGGYVLAPGTIEPRKNHLRLLQAFEDLAREGSIPTELHLVLAGKSGWKASGTLATIAASAVHERIKVLGYVPDDELAALMTGAASVAYVSTYEGYGLPVVEAMACGAVVVTSNVSSMPEAAGGEGILVDPFSIRSIASGILESLGADESLRGRALARAARDTWPDVAAQTASVYDRLA